MTWKSLSDLLAREFRTLRRVSVVSFGFANEPVLDVNELRREELRHAERIDAIVRDFGRTRRWPALDERERFFLRERVRFAYEYASIAEITVHRPISLATRPEIWNEQRRLVEWILIDVWRISGILNWLEPFILMTQSDPAATTEWHMDIAE